MPAPHVPVPSVVRLSKRAEHGLRAAVVLARASDGGRGGYVQSRDLAESEGLPTKFLEAILLVLRRGGVLESKVGAGGGYRLTRPAGEVAVAELLDLLDPPEPGLHDDTLGGRAVTIVAARLAKAATDALDGLTLEDLSDQAAPANDREAMYYI